MPDNAQVIASAPVVHACAIAIGFALNRGFLSLPLPLTEASGHYAGWGVMAPGLVLLMWSMHRFSRAKTAIVPHRTTTRLVAAGPYRFSRNPMYVAMGLIQAGLALMSANAWLLITLPPALLLVRYGAIAREERYLERKFGDAYLEYKTRVRRWL